MGCASLSTLLYEWTHYLTHTRYKPKKRKVLPANLAATSLASLQARKVLVLHLLCPTSVVGLEPSRTRRKVDISNCTNLGGTHEQLARTSLYLQPNSNHTSAFFSQRGLLPDNQVRHCTPRIFACTERVCLQHYLRTQLCPPQTFCKTFKEACSSGLMLLEFVSIYLSALSGPGTAFIKLALRLDDSKTPGADRYQARSFHTYDFARRLPFSPKFTDCRRAH